LAEDQPGPIHLLLTDVVLSEMNGKVLWGELKQSNPDLKVLYMSGYTPDVIMHRGILEKDINFIQKPFSINALTEKVRQVLDTGQPDLKR
jgi:DNA-binding NtrC family response regulator